MKRKVYDYAIVGAGLVGLATAWAIRNEQPSASIVILEKEQAAARHQSGRNSGVLHSGIYYKRGTLKANLTRQGRDALIDFCKQYGIRYELCGKLVLASHENEFKQLENLHQRGIENDIDVQGLDAKEIEKVEPYASGLKAIWIQSAGIVDFIEVAMKLVMLLKERGVEIHFGAGVVGVKNDEVTRLATNGETFTASKAINCAGVYCDRIARMAGSKPGLRIIPFRGEYFRLRQQAKQYVRGLIYPLANPGLPFLGVHLTRTIDGEVLAGPNAVFTTHREGYRSRDFRINDAFESLTYPGFWLLALAHFKTGIGEMVKTWNASAFVKAARKLVPDLSVDDLLPARSGIRAQAVDRKGKLLDDFQFLLTERWLHVLNAPSPAATACFAIGEHIAKQLTGTEA
jgi:L-2-hydroxyglutarate oxidase